MVIDLPNAEEKDMKGGSGFAAAVGLILAAGAAAVAVSSTFGANRESDDTRRRAARDAELREQRKGA